MSAFTRILCSITSAGNVLNKASSITPFTRSSRLFVPVRTLAKTSTKTTTAIEPHNTPSGKSPQPQGRPNNTKISPLTTANTARTTRTEKDIAGTGQCLTYEVIDNIGVITINDIASKVNTLSRRLIDEFERVFPAARDDPTVQGIVLVSGKPTSFIAGADISMLVACQTEEEVYTLSRRGQRMLEVIEKSSKPVVAAIMGSCLGGGLETALACHYRIAVNDKRTVLGFPEVQLGLLPGAGGTQRARTLISLQDCLDLMLTGRQINARKAKAIGLVDTVVNPVGPGLMDAADSTREYVEKCAVTVAKRLASGEMTLTKRQKPILERAFNYGLAFERVRDVFFQYIEKQTLKKTKGLYPAPMSIIEIFKNGTLGKPNEAGYEAEARAFARLGMTQEAKALMGLFFGQTACKNNRFGKPACPVRSIGVVGAGLMGAGIAQVSIVRDIPTVLMDVNTSSLNRGVKQISKAIGVSVRRKKITNDEAMKSLCKLKTSANTSYEHFEKVDLVIEAVFEDLDLKWKVIKELEQCLHSDCIIASNTSALPIGDIAEASCRPDKVIGMHYFSPVDKMQLLEIITTSKTSKETIAAAVDVGLRQGKTVITVKDAPGFYTTRALAAYMAEVWKLLLEDLDFKELDSVTKKIGFPVGSATLIDEVGIDIASHITKFMFKHFGERFNLTEVDVNLLQQLQAKDFLGRKSGKGLFIYSDESVKSRLSMGGRPVNEEAKAIIKALVTPPKIELNLENIRMRLLSRFVNEAVLILEEGVLANPVEGDIGAVFGLGFPPNLGGPFRFVDQYGALNLVKKMDELTQVYGRQFEPCQLLRDHAKDETRRFHKK